MNQHLFAGKAVSHLGFGTAQLARLHTRAGMLRMLETALDLGITHFDMARAYGHGCMEGFCSGFVQRHRAKITLTTKAGLGHIGTAAGTAPGFACRKIMARLRRGLPPPLQQALSPTELERSLEQSLRELRTDHIDFFLLHEHTLAEASSLIPDLTRFQQQGKIGLFGIASYYPALIEGDFSRPVPEGCVIQSNLGTLARPMEERFAACLRITHSVYTGTQDHARALEQALLANRHGIVLVGTTNPEHLAQAARIASAMPHLPTPDPPAPP